MIALTRSIPTYSNHPERLFFSLWSLALFSHNKAWPFRNRSMTMLRFSCPMEHRQLNSCSKSAKNGRQTSPSFTFKLPTHSTPQTRPILPTKIFSMKSVGLKVTTAILEVTQLEEVWILTRTTVVERTVCCGLSLPPRSSKRSTQQMDASIIRFAYTE